MPIRIADLEKRSTRRSIGLALPRGHSGNSALSYRPARPGVLAMQAGAGRPGTGMVHSESYVYERGADYSLQQSPGVVIAGVTVGDALQVGLGAAALVQSGVSASSGSFNLHYDSAQRLLTSQARQAMPGSLSPKQKHKVVLLSVSANSPVIDFANAVITIDWEGNDYGEIGTAVIERDLDSSSEWSRSGFSMTITRYEGIPDRNVDPRAWPLMFTYTGSFDPVGNGHWEFSGKFQIDAFGGFQVLHHKVKSRSLLDFAISGSNYNYVRKGDDVIRPIPQIPADQLEFLKKNLP